MRPSMADDDWCFDDHRRGAHATLHNPDRRNAWSVAMEERYFGLLDEADADPSVRSSCSPGREGASAPASTQSVCRPPPDGALDLAGRRPQTYPLRIRKPMLAAINGACAGIGLMQALNCDVRFAARAHGSRRRTPAGGCPRSTGAPGCSRTHRP